jgi:hypothetical protein
VATAASCPAGGGDGSGYSGGCYYISVRLYFFIAVRAPVFVQDSADSFELGTFVALVVFLEALNPSFFKRGRGSFCSVLLDNSERGIPENAHIGPSGSAAPLQRVCFPVAMGQSQRELVG